MSKKSYGQRFRDEWLNDPRFKDWLRKTEGNDMKGYCKYCKCQFAAKLSDLERYRLTNKHKKAEEPLIGQLQGVSYYFQERSVRSPDQ